MVAYTTSSERKSGLYALIDIGAGTTDMSVFRYMVDGAVPDSFQPHFYSAAVYPAGADRVDEFILNELRKLKAHIEDNVSELLGRIRVAKQDDEDGRKARLQMSNLIPAILYHESSGKFSEELFAKYKQRVWGRAYEKERGPDRWQDLTMFLIGGGSFLNGLKEILAASPWPPFVPPPEVHHLELPSGIACNGSDPAGDCVTRHEHLLMVAFGLSSPFAELDKYSMPDSIETLEPPKPPLSPDWDIGPFDPGS
jgi:hypothetical protein